MTLSVGLPLLTARNSSYTAPFAATFTASPAANESSLLSDADVAAGQSVVSVVTQPDGGAGAVTLLDANGSFVFSPSLGWSGGLRAHLCNGCVRTHGGNCMHACLPAVPVFAW